MDGRGPSKPEGPYDTLGNTRDDRDLTRSYVTVVVVQILVIAALYWFGRHFS